FAVFRALRAGGTPAGRVVPFLPTHARPRAFSRPADSRTQHHGRRAAGPAQKTGGRPGMCGTATGRRRTARRAKGLDQSGIEKEAPSWPRHGHVNTQAGIRSRRFPGVTTRESGWRPSGRSRPTKVTGPAGTFLPSHTSTVVASPVI